MLIMIIVAIIKNNICETKYNTWYKSLSPHERAKIREEEALKKIELDNARPIHPKIKAMSVEQIEQEIFDRYVFLGIDEANNHIDKTTIKSMRKELSDSQYEHDKIKPHTWFFFYSSKNTEYFDS